MTIGIDFAIVSIDSMYSFLHEQVRCARHSTLFILPLNPLALAIRLEHGCHDRGTTTGAKSSAESLAGVHPLIEERRARLEPHDREHVARTAPSSANFL